MNYQISATKIGLIQNADPMQNLVCKKLTRMAHFFITLADP